MTGFFGFSVWIQTELAQRQMLPAGLLVPSRAQKIYGISEIFIFSVLLI